MWGVGNAVLAPSLWTLQHSRPVTFLSSACGRWPGKKVAPGACSAVNAILHDPCVALKLRRPDSRDTRSAEAMETPHVDEFMGFYNSIVSTSSYAVVYFREITGYTAKKKSATRWPAFWRVSWRGDD